MGENISFEQVLERSGSLAYTNKGVSMMPLLRHDRDIMIIHAKDRPLKKNDAVLYRRPNGQYILHRIVQVRKDGTYRIIGDNCYQSEFVPEDRIIGILTQVRRDGETVSCTDPAYLRYVRSVPWRRAVFTPVRLGRRALSKIYHFFF